MYLSRVDRANPQKLYYQLLEILKANIEKGEWKVGAQISTEEQLSGQYNVSRATVRLAIEELVSIGYLKKFQGKGTFVRRRKPDNSIAMLVNLDESDIYNNASCITRVIENKTLHPDKDVINFLNLSGEDHCFFLSRLTIADGAPWFLQRFYISYNLLPAPVNDKEIAYISSHEFLENKCGIKIQRVKEVIDVSNISEKDARFLELASNQSVLRARHICYAHGDTPVSFSESFYRTDLYARTLEFERLRI